MKWLLMLALGGLGSAGTLRAQPGSWPPAGAQLAYPHTLAGAGALPGVRAGLAAPSRWAVYRSLWADVQHPPPTDTVSAPGRLARARWAKNAAFVVLVDRQPTLSGSLAPLSSEQRYRLAASVRSVLSTFSPQGATSPAAWPTCAQELTDGLLAYDLLRGSGEPAAGQGRLQALARALYQQSTAPLGLYSLYSTASHNPTLLTTAALGLASVVLSEAAGADPSQQPASWASVSLYNLDNVLWREAQGLTAEAAGPDGFAVALLKCAPFLQALGSFLPDGQRAYTFGATTRQLRNPYFDPAYRPLYSWLAEALRPPQQWPAPTDTYVELGSPAAALLGQLPAAGPRYSQLAAGKAAPASALPLPDLEVDLRVAWLTATAPSAHVRDAGHESATSATGATSTLLPAFPQPAHDVVQVALAGSAEAVTIQLLDGLGRVVGQQQSCSPARLAVGALPAGCYYLVAYNASGQRLPGRQRVVVAH